MNKNTITYLVIIMVIFQIFTMARIKRDFRLVYERDAYFAKADNEKNRKEIEFRNNMYRIHNMPFRSSEQLVEDPYN